MMPDEQHQADRLGAYADAWLDGRIDEPESAEEATFACLQRVLGTTQAPTPTEFRIIEEDQPMTATITSPLAPPVTRPRSPAMAALSRWQPAISFTIMLVLLGSLFGIAWDRQMRTPDSNPTMFAALQDDATPAAEHCTPPQPSATEEEVRTFSFDDRPSPQYYAIGKADAETTARAIQLFESFWLCASDPTGYLSTRLQHVFMYDELSSDQQGAIEAYWCLPREHDVLQSFPLTLNTQRINPIWQDYPRSQWKDAEVYVLSDGRYGMAMGKLTTDIIRDPSTARLQDSLRFVAFVEENGQLYIDESFIAFSGDPANYSYGQMTGDCD